MNLVFNQLLNQSHKELKVTKIHIWIDNIGII